HHLGDMAGCGTIRVIQPSMILNNFYSPDYQFESIFNNRYTPYPNAYNDCSIVTFQRSASKPQLDMIRHFKKMNPGKKVIYEIDDDILNIPEWNFAADFYNKNRRHIETILRLVDGIVCSTPELKKVLSKYNNNINVSLNHLPEFIWGDVSDNILEDDNTQKRRIMYAGSHNHFDRSNDRGDFSHKLIDFVTKTTDKYQWIFVGGIPQSLKGHKDIIHHEWKPVIEYPRFLKKLRPDIYLAPLDNNKFNRSKSNIKALEAAALGIPLVCSKIEPYDGLTYAASDDEIFIGMIERLADDSELRQWVWKSQYDILKDQLFWEDNDYRNLLDYLNQHLRLLGKEL
ncbi:MAG: hypothetical protein KAS32_03200, partial [Candidatus Peribacteraceae bacterium]|nr:hypothetical protein [Candidatus Peribacteraceae bacterium]